MTSSKLVSIRSGQILERRGKRIEIYTDAMSDQSYILVVLIGCQNKLVDQCYCYRGLNGLNHASWLQSQIVEQLIVQGFELSAAHQIWQTYAMREFNAHRKFTEQQKINTEFLPLGIL